MVRKEDVILIDISLFCFVGAVVAREYGLPCVVAINQATKYFKTGDTVLLSGSSGFLELISRE